MLGDVITSGGSNRTNRSACANVSFQNISSIISLTDRGIIPAHPWHHGSMKLSNDSSVPVYTIAGSSTARPLPEWLQRQRRRSLKKDSEYANRVELLQDFEFEEASACVRVSEDGQWVMSTGKYSHFTSQMMARGTELLTE